MMQLSSLTAQAEALLKQLIATPSFSREEAETTTLISRFLSGHNIPHTISGNNIIARNQYFREGLPLILLNSHHDTVKPNAGWTKDPFEPLLEGDKLTGLGSNDAGGPLVSLIATFLHYYSHSDLPYNLMLAATAEEEISGANGIASVLGEIGPVDLGIIGEPTQMQLAVAERGLMVLDCKAIGKSGHAARNEGINAIYEALPDIEWFQTWQFDKVSDFLGPVKMTVSQIQAGTQHNVVPDVCTFVVDVRVNECYSNQEVFEIIARSTKCEVKARSFRLNSSRIEETHPVVVRGKSMGRTCYGSPTLSDQALIPYPTIKIGPGDSARSHTADEYILLSEIREGISLYITLLKDLRL
ncbi:MAG: M20 family metallo-hydrolase [Bacteroidia bacterium]